MSAHEHPTDDRLLDLVNGLLPAVTRRESLAHVGECRECAGRLREFAATHARAHSLAIEALGAHGSGAGREAIGTLDDAPAPGRARVLRIPAPWWGQRPGLALAAAAAIVVVGVVSYVGMQSRPAPHSMGPIAWLPEPRTGVLTRDSIGTAADARIAQGLEAYRNHDAATAKRLLGQARAEGPLELVRMLYLGNAELQLGDPGAALATLRKVNADAVPEPWRGEAEWSTAAAFAATGQTRAADSLWGTLAGRSDEIGDRARKALASHPGAR